MCMSSALDMWLHEEYVLYKEQHEANPLALTNDVMGESISWPVLTNIHFRSLKANRNPW